MPSFSHGPAAPPPLPPIEALLSSDAVPEELNPYQQITTWLLIHNMREPRRKLDKHTQAFEDNGYFHIDEIADWTEAALQLAPYNLNSGNARYVTVHIKAEMKRVKAERKR